MYSNHKSPVIDIYLRSIGNPWKPEILRQQTSQLPLTTREGMNWKRPMENLEWCSSGWCFKSKSKEGKFPKDYNWGGFQLIGLIEFLEGFVFSSSSPSNPQTPLIDVLLGVDSFFGQMEKPFSPLTGHHTDFIHQIYLSAFFYFCLRVKLEWRIIFKGCIFILWRFF